MTLRYQAAIALFVGTIPFATSRGQSAMVIRNVNLRPTASTTHPAIRLLHLGDTVQLLASRASRGFYRVRAAGDSGWVWSVNVRLLSGEKSVALTPSARSAAGRSCADKHYRWAEKTTSVTGSAHEVTIHEVLTSWPVPAIANTDADWCTDRGTDEQRNISVVAYVRRVKDESDGDWHIELTDQKGGTVTNKCMVVEIPPAAANPAFKKARADLTHLLGLTKMPKQFDATTPIQVRFTGTAFFDGEHRGAATHPMTAHAHGRCNSTARALWEIHPVTQWQPCRSAAGVLSCGFATTRSCSRDPGTAGPGDGRARHCEAGLKRAVIPGSRLSWNKTTR